MVEKLQGGVACAHCRSIADTARACPICGQAICAACQARDNCPAPRPRTLQLGGNTAIQAVDAAGRLALVARLLGHELNAWLHDLTTNQRVAELHTPLGVDEVQLAGSCGLAAGRLVYHLHDSPRATPEHWNHWFIVSELAGGVPRVLHEVETGCRGFAHHAFSSDGRWMLGGYFDVAAYLFDVGAGMKLTTRFDLGDQVIHSLALSAEEDLIAVGLFGAVQLWSLAEQRQLGRLKIEDGELTCLCLGAGKLVAISEDEVPHVVTIDRERPPARWEQRALERFKAGGKLRQGEADLSPDGRLLAARRRKKEVVVIELETGASQRLAGNWGRVSLVRFVAGGRQLLTADLDGGVWLRPREGQRIVPGTA